MEKYLKDEYNVFEDKRYLTKEEGIESFFKDCGSDFLDCGQGYAEDEKTIICKIGDKFYEVEIKAELGSSKQEIGDRLYWIENIESVEYEEIPKPLPKERTSYRYDMDLTGYQKYELEHKMKELNIEFDVTY